MTSSLASSYAYIIFCRELEIRKQQLRNRQRDGSDSKEEIDRDISILEAELQYKMKLREKAIDRKRQEIDDEIEIKIQERDQLVEDRRLLFGYPRETRLSRERERARGRHYNHRSSSYHEERSTSRGRQESLSPRYRYPTEDGRSRSRSRGLHRRSRSRSLSTERAPSFGHISPRSPRTRARSLSPMRSVSFDESLNSHHRYGYDDYLTTYDSGFGEGAAAGLDQVLVLMMGVVFLLAFGTFMRFYLVSWLGERVSADLRREVFSHVIDLHPGFFETNLSGEIHVPRSINQVDLVFIPEKTYSS